MKTWTRCLTACVGALFLAACGTQLEVAEKAEAEGTPFSEKLYEGYLELSRAEYDEGDYKDSDGFAERAIRAAGGLVPPPEAVTSRRLPAGEVAQLEESRERLVSFFASGAIEKFPAEAARAQIMFDCWMQEQEENRQPDDIGACRSDFFDAMAYLEEGLASPQVAKAQAPAAQPVAKAPVAPKRIDGAEGFVVYFGFDESELSQEAISVLMEVVITANQKGMAIRARGHTDLTGKKDYNARLAQKRVEAVAQFLIESGIEKGRIDTAAFGDLKPAVAASEGQPEAKNRRVEIEFTPLDQKISGAATTTQ